MTYNEINTLAEKYAAQYNPNKLTPFPYEDVAKARGDLTVIHLDPDDSKVSGVILYEEADNKFSILINATKSLNRQHFTLGHELGHYFLHQDILKTEKGFIDGEKALDNSNILYRLDDAMQTQLETEANHFAAGLLMPSHLVEEAWDVVHDIQECAKLFNVSSIAMSIRLTELKLVS
jgi:Zn-dependent peptidase ImmA (M78 family)